MSKKEVIPSGSITPPIMEATSYREPDEAQLPDGEEEAEPVETQEQAEQELLLGKFKSSDELANAYKELENKFGSQGSEVGNLRKQNEQLMQFLSSQQAQQGQPAGAKENDWDSQLGAIKSAVESGDMDISEALTKTAEITAAKAAGLFESKIQEYDKNKQAEEMQKQFLTKHPDFGQLNQQGVLDQYIADNPVLDRISAYYAYKADTASQEAQRKFEEGKSEGQKFAATADGQRKVLSKPGTSGRSAVSGRRAGPVSESDLVAKQLAALQAMRGGGAGAQQ
jgi:hypothetical protein